ncbi:hypothetical protein [Sphingomonas xanthus]|uniref:Secreted protein n=1 Tax=Sphingomonas xanthus TaxID=2594473 RepID=A0A516ITH5_9SPHN|nr:hypothetical protein [Sphingomonas xanthus]QDP20193.1 hypothetical protein FMM02_09660 [Sphingomonas xanthus]
MSLFPALAIYALLASSPATAEPAAQGEAVTSEARSEDAGDKMVCKSKRDHRTGSNMRAGRECRTAAEWKERERAAQRELTRLRDKQQTPGNALGR